MNNDPHCQSIDRILNEGFAVKIEAEVDDDGGKTGNYFVTTILHGDEINWISSKDLASALTEAARSCEGFGQNEVGG